MITDKSGESTNSYIVKRGGSVNDFCKNVRNFFTESRDNYKNVFLISKISTNLGISIDMNNIDHRKILYREIKKYENINNFYVSDWIKHLLGIRRTVDRWSDGSNEPSPIALLNYCDNVGIDVNDPKLWDNVKQSQYALARTLMFLRIYPWPNGFESWSEPHVNEKTEWQIWHAANLMFRNDKIFKDRKANGSVPVSQLLMDRVLEAYPQIIFDPQNLGKLRFMVENQPDRFDPWFASYCLLKYGTYVSWNDTDRLVLWVWDDFHNDSKKIWCING